MTLNQAMNKHCLFLYHLFLCFSPYNMCGYAWTECFLLSFMTFACCICLCALDGLILSLMLQNFFFSSFISYCILSSWVQIIEDTPLCQADFFLSFLILFFRWCNCLIFLWSVLLFCQWNIISSLTLVSSVLVSTVLLPLLFLEVLN